MAKSKTSKDQGSKATVRQLRAELKRAETKRATWKKRAKEAETAVADLKARLRKADKQAAQQATQRVDKQVEDARTDSTSTPDASWTVAQLRTEARRRGISGMSNKPKAELVKALG